MGFHRMQQLLDVSLVLIVFSFCSSCGEKMEQKNSVNTTEVELSRTSLEKHLSVLAHDSLGGRETGTIGIEKAAQYIENHFRNIGLEPIADSGSYRQWYTLYDEINAFNVIGMISGDSIKDEYVVVSGHYDHLGIRSSDSKDSVYNGADDNGSGTAGILVMAEKMMKEKAQGKGPKRNVVFILFSGEEKGLLGSDYFAENPLVELDKISIDVNIDMIGRIDTERESEDTNRYVHVVGSNKMSTDLMPILTQVNKEHQLNLDAKFDEPNDRHRIFYRSDHYNFAKNGVPILFFYDGMLEGDYHELTDHIEFIDWEVYEKRSKFIYDFIKSCADRTSMLKRDIPFE